MNYMVLLTSYISNQPKQIVFIALVTDIEDDYPSPEDMPDFYFPVVQTDITECSTYAVVCRLKLSPSYTITSGGGTFTHPDYPGVTVMIPKKAVSPKARFPLHLKVGMIPLTPLGH